MRELNNDELISVSGGFGQVTGIELGADLDGDGDNEFSFFVEENGDFEFDITVFQNDLIAIGVLGTNESGSLEISIPF